MKSWTQPCLRKLRIISCFVQWYKSVKNKQLFKTQSPVDADVSVVILNITFLLSKWQNFHRWILSYLVLVGSVKPSAAGQRRASVCGVWRSTLSGAWISQHPCGSRASWEMEFSTEVEIPSRLCWIEEKSCSWWRNAAFVVLRGPNGPERRFRASTKGLWTNSDSLLHDGNIIQGIEMSCSKL